MGVELIKEVLAHSPAALSVGQQMVLVVMAEDFNDRTRRGWPGMDKLTLGSKLTDRGVRDVIEGLVDLGVVIRIPIGIDRRGRPMYAHRGRTAEFEIAPLLDGEVIHSPAKGGSPVPPLPPEKGGTGEQKGGTPRQKGGTPVPPSRHIPSGPVRSPRASPDDLDAVVDAVEARTGKRIDLDQAARIVRQLVGDRPGIRRPARYAATAIANDPAPARFLPTPTPPPFRAPDQPERPS